MKKKKIAFSSKLQHQISATVGRQKKCFFYFHQNFCGFPAPTCTPLFIRIEILTSFK